MTLWLQQHFVKSAISSTSAFGPPVLCHYPPSSPFTFHDDKSINVRHGCLSPFTSIIRWRWWCRRLPPNSRPVVQWGARVAWRQLRHEAAPTAPPPPPPLTSYWHRWRCVCSGVCVCMCGNVVLVHFPTIAVGHGPGTHLACLYNCQRFLSAQLFYV